jgi:hypothetical protein
MATTHDGTLQIWDLWIPGVGAVGISFARGRLAATDTLLVHAAPQKLTVEVVDERGVRVARGQGLSRSSDTRMARLRRAGDPVTREVIWPSEADYGMPVLLAGGEVGGSPHGGTRPTTPPGAGALSCITTGDSGRRQPAAARSPSDALDDRRGAQAAAAAHRLQAVAAAAPLQLVQQRYHQSRARGAERVAERDGAAVDVNALHVWL